jgi:hypothetical protein
MGGRGRSPLPGGLGDVPPRTKEKGRVANSYHPATSGTKNAGKPSASEGGQKGGPRGVSPLAGGLGGVPSDLTPWPLSLRGKGKIGEGKGGGEANPATSGALNAGEPSAHEGGQIGGSRGAKPPWRGAVGGVPPHKFQKGGEQLTPATKQRVGPRTLANPQPTGVGNGGGGGAAPSQGVWGMCPQNKKRGRIAHISQPATSGTQNAGKP